MPHSLPQKTVCVRQELETRILCSNALIINKL